MIVRQGYGFAYARFSFEYLEDFRRYESEAREDQKGLWREFGSSPGFGYRQVAGAAAGVIAAIVGVILRRPA